MDCRRAQDMLHAWLDDELTETEREELSAHLDGCPECAKRLAEYRHLDALLGQLKAQTKVPAGLFGRIMEAVESEPMPGKTQSHRRTRWAASAAAVVLLGVTVGVLWRAGVFSGPMTGKMEAQYDTVQAEEASPQEPRAAMGDTNGEEGGEFGAGLAGTSEAPAAENYAADSNKSITWTPENRSVAGDESPLDMVNAYCEENGLTVVETGDDYISVWWQDAARREALIGFLEKNGEISVQAEDENRGTQVLRIDVR